MLEKGKQMLLILRIVIIDHFYWQFWLAFFHPLLWTLLHELPFSRDKMLPDREMSACALKRISSAYARRVKNGMWLHPIEWAGPTAWHKPDRSSRVSLLPFRQALQGNCDFHLGCVNNYAFHSAFCIFHSTESIMDCSVDLCLCWLERGTFL